MADAIVVPDEGVPPGAEIAADAAHAAAVAEGGAAVREEIAEEHADEAKAAAAVALEVAQENAETAQAVIEATGAAEQSAEVAKSSADLVLQALEAQSAAFNALRAELEESRKSSAPAAPAESKPSPEHKPGGQRPRWTRR